MAISLQKGERVNLTKTAATETPATTSSGGLRQIFMGLGWDVAQVQPAARSGGLWGSLFGGGNSGGSASIDLDASCLAFDVQGKLRDQVWFRQLRGLNGALEHTGDNLTGEGDGDDEVIRVDLSRLPADIMHLVFTVNSFRGQSFDRVQNAYCRLVDEATQTELVRFTLSEAGSHTGLVLARLLRQGSDWHFQALGDKTQGRTFQDMLPLIQSCLAR